MVRITEDLIRRRAEHNEGQLSNLEEVSLHQQDIERIEHIDKWCRDLKILYLQSNLIPRIENVGRLKKLEYINLALNNVERVENLEGCESLKKLDLTVNFVGELTSIECLSRLEHFQELFLTGNPCTEYDYYKEYVIATLPHLKYLDGSEITRSERLLAEQVRVQARRRVLEQEAEYRRKRTKQKEVEEERLEKKKNAVKPGFDGRWYTDIDNTQEKEEEKSEEGKTNGSGEDAKDPFNESDKQFWDEAVPFTPESRVEVHEQMKKQRERTEKSEKDESIKPERRLITDDGRPLNVNEAKIDFSLEDDEKNNKLLLNIETYKYLDTSLMDIDVQPGYVRATIKGKIFQLVLPEAVRADSSSAKRSQITGHLLIEMPKVNEIIRKEKPTPLRPQKEKKSSSPLKSSNGHERLEVDSNKQLDLNIVQENLKNMPKPLGYHGNEKQERENSPDFVDDPDVPPLE